MTKQLSILIATLLNLPAFAQTNFMITCTVTDAAQRAVILSSDKNTILGHKVLKTPPSVFLHEGEILVGRAPLNVVSKKFDPDSQDSILEFLTPDRFSYANIRIHGMSPDFTPGIYKGEGDLDIILGTSRMQGTSVPCQIALDNGDL